MGFLLLTRPTFRGFGRAQLSGTSNAESPRTICDTTIHCIIMHITRASPLLCY
ncbi:MAG: hypothetical protein K5685_11185 [Bacteroidales bacterium]|nr:hypothetical protein [Bacteroidales bacterium]